MEGYGMPSNGGPIGVMLMEHDEGRKYVNNAVEAIENYKSGNPDSIIVVKDNLLNYLQTIFIRKTISYTPWQKECFLKNV